MIFKKHYNFCSIITKNVFRYSFKKNGVNFKVIDFRRITFSRFERVYTANGKGRTHLLKSSHYPNEESLQLESANRSMALMHERETAVNVVMQWISFAEKLLGSASAKD